MSSYKAFIFDLNGTMIDDMHYHEKAWYGVLVNDLKAPLTIEQVRHQMYGKSSEMFERVFGKGKFSKEEVAAISERKEKRYRDEFLPDLKLINGLQKFLDDGVRNGIGLAIGTAAPKLNVDFVIDNLNLTSYFPVIIGAADVRESKPDPEVFLMAAKRLGISPHECVVFEDAPKGIEAAARAGMKAVAVTSYHTVEELQFENVILWIQDYTDSNLNMLF